MGLFSRNKTVVPDIAPQVQDYYQAETSRRSPMAWLLGLATLLVTILVVVGLFFGGRFVLRKLKSNDKPTPVAVQVTDTKPSKVTPVPSSNPNNGKVDAPQSATNPDVVTTTTTNLPNTGPTSTLAVFAAVSLLVYLLHRKFSSAV